MPQIIVDPTLEPIVLGLQEYVDMCYTLKEGTHQEDFQDGDSRALALFALAGLGLDGQRYDLDPLSDQDQLQHLFAAPHLSTMRDYDSFFGMTFHLPYNKAMDVFIVPPEKFRLTDNCHLYHPVVRGHDRLLCCATFLCPLDRTVEM